MIYKEELERIQREIQERKETLLAELSDMPDGQLYIMAKGGKNYYFQRLPKVGRRKKEHRYGITGNKDMVMKLVRKAYVTAALETIEKDKELIDTAAAGYRPFDEATLMKAFADKHPELVEGIYYNCSDYFAWADSYSPHTDHHEENLTSTYANGTRMRSKGELYIASRLEYYKIPYRYEAEIGIPDFSYIPDFTIRRPRDGKIIYWEHMGRVNDEQYMSDNSYKLSQYERYGIVPWDNLIVTYNMKNGGINAKLIEALIQGWLL